MPSEDYGGYSLGDDVRLRGANHAFEGKVFNIVVSSVIDGSFIEKLGDTEEKRRILSSPQSSFTGVFAPGGKLFSEVVPPGEEGIIYADCDIEAIIGPKLRHDVAGQYNRFDVLSLNLNRTPNKPIVEYEDDHVDDEIQAMGKDQNEALGDPSRDQ